MDKWIKGLRVIICAALLVALCACSANSASQEQLAQLNQQIASLESQIEVLEEQLSSQGGEDYEGENEAETVDVESLLNRIASSGEALTAFPALVTGGSVSETGSTLKFDRLEYNPGFEMGSEGEEAYLLNAEETEEETDASYAWAQYDAHIESEIGLSFMDYVATFGSDGAQFTFYMLGDELVLVSEITVP
jgi:TolA-binding protein